MHIQSNEMVSYVDMVRPIVIIFFSSKVINLLLPDWEQGKVNRLPITPIISRVK